MADQKAAMTNGLARGVVRWKKHPGAFDLVDVPETDLDDGQLEFLHARDGTRARFADLRGRWRRLRRQLQGLTEHEVLCRDERAAVSLLRLYRPPGGRAAITYRRTVALDGGGDFSLFGVGFGAGGSVNLSSVLDFTADETNLEMLLHLPVTAVRHRNPRTNQSLLQVDLGSRGQSVDYELRSFREGPPTFDPDAYDRLQWHVLKRILLAGSRSSEMVTWTYADMSRDAYWHGGLDIGGLVAPAMSLQIGIKCRRADAYHVEFSLPHGHDYIFFSPAGETLIAPLCRLILSVP